MELEGYDAKSRSYRPECSRFPDLQTKVFHEKDIPIQVAIGNYDLGICGVDWVEELLAKYPYSALVKVYNLGYGEGHLRVAASSTAGISSIDELKSTRSLIRVASEYPNLAESFALNMRLKRFSIFPLWGSAEAYPPENADLVITHETSGKEILQYGLSPVTTILRPSAFLIANSNSWESKDMSSLINLFYTIATKTDKYDMDGSVQESKMKTPATVSTLQGVRIALPDGHQQKPTLEFLDKVGIRVGKDSKLTCRPSIGIDGVTAKLIRPQDMPLQVANGGFDLAITGQDWVRDHLCKFPSSPVRELLNLGFGTVRIVAVMKRDTGIKDIQDLRDTLEKGVYSPLRIASEYVNIADRFARDNHLSPCRLIPTWGATEAFLPEDADLLIENTQTGRTLEEHNLEIVSTLFESSACLIGRIDGNGKPKIASIVETLRRGIEA